MTKNQLYYLSSLESRIYSLEHAQLVIQDSIVNATIDTSPILKKVFQYAYKKQKAKLIEVRKLHRDLINKHWYDIEE